MIKRSLSRNPRSKGIKAKHVLQICVLLGVCFWLVYQVKRSHDKEFDEKDAKVPIRGQVDDVVPKLGRKDLHPRVQEVTKNEKHEEDEEEETVLDEAVNEEENKHLEEKEASDHEKQEQEEGIKHEEEERKEENMHEEEEQEEEINSEETEDDGRGVGDDEIDEHDQEKIEREGDRDEDFIDEENEREDGEKGSESTESEDKEAQVDYETSSDDEDHNEGGWNAHEAREEHYKADDASSEVTHDTENINREPDKGRSGNSNENSAKNDLSENNSNNTEEIIGGQNDSTIQLGQVEMAEDGHPVNATASEKKDNQIILSNSEDKSPTNTTFTSLSNDQPDPSNATSTETNLESLNNSADGGMEISSSYQRNETVIMSDSTQAQHTTVDGATTGEISNLETTQLEQDSSDSKQSGQNSTIPSKTQSAGIIDKDTLNATSNSESDASARTVKPGVAAETEVKSGSSTTEQTKDASHNENSYANNESGGTDEISDSSTSNGTADEVIQGHSDASDSSITQDSKDDRVVMGALLENGTDVNSIGAAAE